MAKTATTKPQRLVPVPDPITEPFWKAASEGRLVAQRCRECSRSVFYPRAVCPHCGGRYLDWEELSGRGKIYSFTVVHRPAHPGMAAAVPYVVALVELEEGPRLMSNVIHCEPDEVSIGMEVEVCFERLSEQISIPLFRPAASK